MKCGGIREVSAETFAKMVAETEAEKGSRAQDMPTEQDAINAMHAAYLRLKDLGWRDAVYCPKDGSEFDAIEVGSVGIHKAHYSGEWPDGHWWVAEAGDLWPSRPSLYRPTEEEKARWEEARKRFRAMREGQGTGEAA